MTGHAIGRLGDQFRRDCRLVNQHSDDAIDPRGWMPHQQLQDADVMPIAGARAVLSFERLPQLVK
jgi:hypothetical protein